MPAHRLISLLTRRALHTMPSMPRPRVTPQGRAALDNILEREVASRTIPATFLGAANADGEIYWNCAGEQEYGTPGEVTDQTLLQMYSMTKLVTSVSLLRERPNGRWLVFSFVTRVSHRWMTQTCLTLISPR